MNSIDLFIKVIKLELQTHPEWKELNQQMFMKKLFTGSLLDNTSKNLGKVYSNWKNDPKINDISEKYKTVITDILGLEDDIWNLNNDSEQKNRISDAIKIFLSPSIKANVALLISQNSLPDISQKNYLLKIKELPLSKIEVEIKNNVNGFFVKSNENQTFLLELMDYLYQKGLYELLDNFIFSNLTASNNDNFEVKKIRAYTLGSLKTPRYFEAKTILESLIYANNNTKVITDLHISLISNIRRDFFSVKNLDIPTIENYIESLLEDYSNIFEKEKCYYSGINLAYIVALKDIFNLSTPSYSIEEIYQSSELSINRDKNLENEDNKYYARISQIEFKLLLYHYQENDIKELLEDLSPSLNTVKRTKRQMKQFHQLVLQHKPDIHLKHFEKTITILDSYLMPKYQAKVSKNSNIQTKP